jgi:4'-phosphopantetheinyl transferase EntD
MYLQNEKANLSLTIDVNAHTPQEDSGALLVSIIFKLELQQLQHLCTRLDLLIG